MAERDVQNRGPAAMPRGADRVAADIDTMKGKKPAPLDVGAMEPNDTVCRDCWYRGRAATLDAMKSGMDAEAARLQEPTDPHHMAHDLRSWRAGRDATLDAADGKEHDSVKKPEPAKAEAPKVEAYKPDEPKPEATAPKA